MFLRVEALSNHERHMIKKLFIAETSQGCLTEKLSLVA